MHIAVAFCVQLLALCLGFQDLVEFKVNDVDDIESQALSPGELRSMRGKAQC